MVEVTVSRNEHGWTARVPFEEGIAQADGNTAKEAAAAVIEFCREITKVSKNSHLKLIKE